MKAMGAEVIAERAHRNAGTPDRVTQIQARNFNFYYGAFHALKNINVEIYRRHVTAFIGPSGCGKSTFLRCINRMNDTIPCLLYTSPSPRDRQKSRMPSSA